MALKSDRHRCLVLSSHEGSGGFTWKDSGRFGLVRAGPRHHRHCVPPRWWGRADATGASELGQKVALGRESAQLLDQEAGGGIDALVVGMVVQELPDDLCRRKTGSQPIAIVNEALSEAGPFRVRRLLEPAEVHGHRLGIAEQPG